MELHRMPIEELCPDHPDEFYPPGWHDLVTSLGVTIVEVSTSGDSYQGDTAMLVTASRCLGWLVFGWGSCSGCDSLQACSQPAHVDRLRDDVARSIRWFDTSEEFDHWAAAKDWELEYHDFGPFALELALTLTALRPEQVPTVAAFTAEHSLVEAIELARLITDRADSPPSS